jgi:hypothetical protein
VYQDRENGPILHEFFQLARSEGRPAVANAGTQSQSPDTSPRLAADVAFLAEYLPTSQVLALRNR